MHPFRYDTTAYLHIPSRFTKLSAHVPTNETQPARQRLLLYLYIDPHTSPADSNLFNVLLRDTKATHPYLRPITTTR